MQKSKSKLATPKVNKPSIAGLLFKPQLGPTLTPLRDTTRIFLQLLAGVFSLYGLFPKDHPSFKDSTKHLTISEVISTAWSRIEFTREGASKTLIFFAVVGMMAFSGLMAVFAILGLFVGHAHAAAVLPTASAFQPETKDLAQAWLEYLFTGPSGGPFPVYSDNYGDANASMADPFANSISLQSALMKALAFYSDAILIVAVIILFYHLTAMVVETAHHGVPMGKRANQIWAPIRLVVAIGLLVPINGGLNAGQFLVIWIAEMGSGMASQAWDIFLTKLADYNTTSVPPSAALSAQVAIDITRMEACLLSWNYHIGEQTAANLDYSAAIMQEPQGKPYMLGNISGTKYSYSSNAVVDTEACGWYFIPDGGSGANNSLEAAAAAAQKTAINQSMPDFQKAAKNIYYVIPQAGDTSAPQPPVTLDSDMYAAIVSYQTHLDTAIAGISNNQAAEMSTAITTIKQYGWVMAGTFLNTIDRMQANINIAAADSIVRTDRPKVNIGDEPENKKSLWARLTGTSNDGAWSIRKEVSEDMQSFDYFQNINLSQPPTQPTAQQAECAAMVGLTPHGQNGSGLAETLFGLVDSIAASEGVWSSGTGVTCQGVAAGATTFKLGVQFSGHDPFAQMASLGHANLNVAFKLAAYGMGASAVGAVASLVPWVGGFANNVLSGAGGMAYFLALVFFICGFSLAYLLPLMPFMRFFFSVISWVGAIIEAIIAIPLVALAHLTPEGDGLPGQSAKGAYFFVFNLFLRPILTVFGLICGLIIFLIALSFLNYAFAIAVSGAGGTSYGHATISKIIYTIMYVIILYISANHSFALIDHLPEQALRWMGASGPQSPKMGDVSNFESKAGAISSYAGQQAIGKAQQFGDKTNQQISGWNQKRVAGNEADAKAAAADEANATRRGAPMAQLMADRADIGPASGISAANLMTIAERSRNSGRDVNDILTNTDVLADLGHPGADRTAVAADMQNMNILGRLAQRDVQRPG